MHDVVNGMVELVIEQVPLTLNADALRDTDTGLSFLRVAPVRVAILGHLVRRENLDRNYYPRENQFLRDLKATNLHKR